MKRPRVLFGLCCVLVGCGAPDLEESLQASGKAETRPAESQWVSLFGVPLSPLNADSFEKWVELREQIDREMPCYLSEVDCGILSSWAKRALGIWRDELKEIALQPGVSKRFARVNSWVNEWPYVTDAPSSDFWEHWARPLELMAGSGDCEDLAIMKYVSLLILGIANDDLLLVAVKDLHSGQNHALVAVRHEQVVYILDNQIKRVFPEEEHNGRYVPLFAMNHTRILGNIGRAHDLRALSAPGQSTESADHL